MSHSLTPVEIRSFIHHLRGKAVMLDKDLAELYQVDTRTLNQAVKRNHKRFPEDFMFQLTEEEAQRLRSQFVISKPGRGGRRYLPYAFTEQGVAMLSTALNSEVAIQTNIQIMRAFVQIRRLGLSIVDVRRKIDSMERKYDHQFKAVFDTFRKLLAPEPKNKRVIGFVQHKKN